MPNPQGESGVGSWRKAEEGMVQGSGFMVETLSGLRRASLLNREPLNREPFEPCPEEAERMGHGAWRREQRAPTFADSLAFCSPCHR